MKIDNFFRKQADRPAVQGPKDNLESGCSRKSALCSSPDNDTRVKSDKGSQSVLKRPREDTMLTMPQVGSFSASLLCILQPKRVELGPHTCYASIKSSAARWLAPFLHQEQSASTAAVSTTAPLSEATNRQRLAQSAAMKASVKSVVQDSAIDLRDSPPCSPVKCTAHQQHAADVAVDSSTADHEQAHGDKMGDTPALPAAEDADAARVRTFSPAVQHQQQTAGAEPATPVMTLKTAGSDGLPGSAVVVTIAAKTIQEVFLTPDQRIQLLEGCVQVGEGTGGQ